MGTKTGMERSRIALSLTGEEAMTVDHVKVNPHRPHKEMSFYEDFSTRGIRVLRFRPGLIVCSLKVPPRLIDREGNLASGAIFNLIDEIGASLVLMHDQPMSVSVNMSASILAAAKVDDEIEVRASLVGKKGAIVGTNVVLTKKATGETIAEGRHSLFCKHASKL